MIPAAPRRVFRWLRRAVHRGSAVNRDDVAWAFRTFLGRLPESEAVVEAHLGSASQRVLVERILQSPEYARRLRLLGAESLIGPVLSRPGLRQTKGPRALVVSDCQAPGFAAALAACCGVSEVMPVAAGNVAAEVLRGRLDERAPRADLWFCAPENGVARQHFERHGRRGARLVTVPSIGFGAFHPDVRYARDRASQRQTTAPYNSAIVVWAYNHGLKPAAAAELFHADIYRALGYLDAWGPAVETLRRAFEASDLAPSFDTFLRHLQRHGCFMNTPNHPRIVALVHLARLAAAHAGLEVHEPPAPGELDDGLNGLIWPVYPEVAQALGLSESGLTWRFVQRKRYVDGARAFVDESYAAYSAQGIVPGQLELRSSDAGRIDRILDGLAGRAA